MNNTNNLLLIVNPISGGTDKRELIRRVAERASERNLRLEIYQTTGHGDQEKIVRLLNSFGPHRVLVSGGDGTIKLLAEALSDQSLPIGILPSGSANGLALNLGLPQDPDEAIRIALGERWQFLDAIRINGHLCLHVSDLGLNAELIKHYESGTIRGKLGYVLQSIPTLIQSDMPFSFEVTIGETTYRRQGILLAIANAQKYGTGATINPEGKLDDGKFEVLIFKKFDVLEIIKTLGEETNLDPDFRESFSATQAEVRCQPPVPFQIDGEYYGETEHLAVSILPKHLRVAVPGIVG